MQNEPTDGQSTCDDVQEDHRAVLKVGGTLSIDAFSSSGLLLLRAGHIIEDRYHLTRLLEPDVHFGSYTAYMAKAGPPSDKPSGPSGSPPAANTTAGPPRARRPSQPSAPGAEAVPPKTQPANPYSAYSVARPPVEQPQAAPLEPVPTIPENLHHAYAVKSEAVSQVQGVFDRIEASGDLDITVVENTVCSLMDRVFSDGLAIAALTQIKDADAYTYCHSVNVGILSMYLALATNYEDRIRQIGLGGLLHDVGKLSIPTAVLRKKGPLDNAERSIINEHPGAGARLIREAGCTDPIVISCVQDHHEKITGRGYPRRKPACEISPCAKIISVADVFDALTTDRPYRRAMTAEAALVLMVDEMGDSFDPWLLHRFVEVAGSIADQTYVTPDGRVAVRGEGRGAPTQDFVRKPPVFPRFDAAA